MANSAVSKKDFWAIEVELDDRRPSKYYSVSRMQADGDHFELITIDGQRIRLPRDKIRKVLVMKTSDKDKQ